MVVDKAQFWKTTDEDVDGMTEAEAKESLKMVIGLVRTFQSDLGELNDVVRLYRWVKHNRIKTVIVVLLIALFVGGGSTQGWFDLVFRALTGP